MLIQGERKLARVKGFNALQFLQSPELQQFWLSSFGRSVKEVSTSLFSDALEVALELADAPAASLIPSIITACDKDQNGAVSVVDLAMVELKTPALLGPLVNASVTSEVILVGSSSAIDAQRSQFDGRTIHSFTSLSEAINSLQSDEKTVFVCPGEYRESVVFTAARSVRVVGLLPSDAPAAARPQVTFINSPDRPVFSFAGGSSKIRNLTIRSSSTDVTAISITSGTIAIENCTVIGGSQGIYVDGPSTDVTIHDSQVSESSKQGISVENTARAIISDTQVTRTTMTCIRISGSHVSVLSCKASKSTTGSGIVFDKASSGEIRDCVIESNATSGLLLDLGSSAQIESCASSGNRGSGFLFSGESRAECKNCHAEGSGKNGFSIEGESIISFVSCDAVKSIHHGFSIERASCTFQSCVAEANSDSGFFISNNASPRLSACISRGNKECGVWIQNNSTPTVEDGSFTQNTGSGMTVLASSPNIWTCRFDLNGIHGLVIQNQSEPVIERCEFASNKQSGIQILSHSQPTISNCTLSESQVSGIQVEDAFGTISDMNLLQSAAVGIIISGKASNRRLVFRNCIISGAASAGIRVENNASPLIEQVEVSHSKIGFVSSTGAFPRVVRSSFDHNQVYGVSMEAASKPELEEVRCQRNGDSGFLLSGQGCNPRLKKCVAQENADAGFWCQKRAAGSLFECQSLAAGNSGFVFQEAAATHVIDCVAKGCDKHGFQVDASCTCRLIKCSASFCGEDAYQFAEGTKGCAVTCIVDDDIAYSFGKPYNPLFWKSGIQNDVDESLLSGWVLKYQKPYSNKTTLEEMNGITSKYVLVAGRRTGNSKLFVCAMALRSEAFLPGSSTTEAHEANGTFWYFNEGKSMGFAPNPSIQLGSADTVDSSSDLRISWHLDRSSGGWRCGSNTGLNDSSEWEKLVYGSIDDAEIGDGDAASLVSAAQQSGSAADADAEINASGAAVAVPAPAAAVAVASPFGGLFWRSGIFNDTPISTLVGWKLHFVKPYSHSVTMDELKNIPSDVVLCGARLTGSDKLMVGAMAKKSEAFDSSSDSTTVARSVNGAYWYCVAGKSFGFAPTSSISLGSADTVDQSSDERISWHLTGSGGWRAGSKTGLNSSSEYEKVIFIRDPDAPASSMAIVDGSAWAQGVLNDVHMSSLIGWQLSYCKPYSHHTTLAELEALSGDAIMVGARRAGTQVLTVCAMAKKSEALVKSTSSMAARPVNGAFWYCVSGKSFGFAPSANISLQAADTTDQRNNQRLSWALTGSGGWRAGNQVNLNRTEEWEKIILVRTAIVAPPPPVVPSYWKSGIQNDVPISALVGWTLAYSKPYSHVTTIAELQALDGDDILVGGRLAGSQILSVCAMAAKSEAVDISSSSTTVARPVNGAFWYCVTSKSFGFAPTASISLGSADTVDSSNNQRISWHLSGSGGWRMGSKTGLNSSSEYEKVVFVRKRNAAAAAVAAPSAPIAPFIFGASVPAVPASAAPNNLFWRSGILNDIDMSSLTGWTLSYQKPYSHKTKLEELRALPGTAFLVAGRRIGTSVLSVCAMAMKSDALHEQDSTTEARPVNGAFWYCTTLKSFGFAPNRTIALGAADTVDRDSSNQRISWHIDETSGGWRCGTAVNLNDSSDWEKLVFTASPAIAPAESGAVISGAPAEPPAYWASGIQNNVDIARLVGWELNYCKPYSHVTTLAELQAIASDSILVGARRAGSSQLAVCAMAKKSEALELSESTSVARAVNGAFWYCVRDKSFGFANNSSIALGSADTVESSSEQRISWHLSGSGGWRAGSATGLNSSSEWEKCIFIKRNIAAVIAPIVCPPGPLFWRSGILNDTPIASLTGWTLSYQKPYSHKCTLAEFQALPGNCMLVAGRRLGSSTLAVSAMAMKADALVEQSSMSEARPVNGAYWYCTTRKSFGFAPNAIISLGAADTVDRDSSNQRISWHIDETSGGWRCGTAVNLNDSSEWEKLVFTATRDVGASGSGASSDFWASGVLNDIPVASLTGWELSFCKPYSHKLNLEELNALPGDDILVGARRVATPGTLMLCAMAPKSEALDISSTSTTVARPINGAFWYCVRSKAFGFAPAANINLGSADTVEREGGQGNKRLSWHLTGSGGWRAGNSCGLNSSSEFEKVVFTRTRRAAPVLAAAADGASGSGAGGSGSAPFPIVNGACWSEGIHRDISISSLHGWQVSYVKPYSHATSIEELQTLDSEAILVGARRAGSDVLSVCAMGNKTELLLPSASDSEARLINGAYWYCNLGNSFGFAPSATIALEGSRGDAHDAASDEQRVSWRLDGSGGYRAGAAVDLQDSAEWEKVVLVRRPLAAAAEPVDIVPPPGPLFWAPGIMNDVAVSSLSGWTLSYQKPYCYKTTLQELKDLPGTAFLVAGRRIGTSALSVAAMAMKSDALLESSSTSEARPVNGAYWYCTPGKSFGFAPNRVISLGSSDTVDRESSNQRISWHIDERSGGWRCGTVVNLNDSSEWEKLIFTASPEVQPIPSPVAALTFSGIRNNVSLSLLAGWQLSYCKPYSHVTTLEELQSIPADSVLVGARKRGAEQLHVCAMATKAEAFDSVSSSSTTVARSVNGAYWYCVPSKAFGFANSETIALGSADTVEASSEQRLSWHLSGSGGWRAGSSTGLNRSEEWEKVIYTRFNNGLQGPDSVASAPGMLATGIGAAGSASGSGSALPDNEIIMPNPSGPLFWKSGVQRNLAISDLSGWSLSYQKPYCHVCNLDEFKALPGTAFLVAGRRYGSPELYVAAMGMKSEVLREDASTSVAHAVNGAYFYCIPDKSFGFAASSAISCGAADTNDAGGAEYRLSWHIDTRSGGWRCGDNKGLNDSSSWEKLIFTASPASQPSSSS